MTEYEVHVSATRCRHPPRLPRSVSSSLRGCVANGREFVSGSGFKVRTSMWTTTGLSFYCVIFSRITVEAFTRRCDGSSPPTHCMCHNVLSALRRKSSPDLSKLGDKLVYGGDGDLIAELTKGSRQHLGALFLFSRTYFVALLDESHSFM